MEVTSGNPAYYVVERDQKKGPFEIAILEQMCQRNEVVTETLVWTDGMADWLPARVALPQLFPSGQAGHVIAGAGQRVLSGIIDFCVVQALIIVVALGTAGFGIVIEFGFPLANALYAGVMLSTEWQGTVGKKLLGLKVINASGGKPSSGQIWGRAFGTILSLLTLGVGNLFVFFTPHRQALHDMLARTVVIKDSVT